MPLRTRSLSLSLSLCGQMNQSLSDISQVGIDGHGHRQWNRYTADKPTRSFFGVRLQRANCSDSSASSEESEEEGTEPSIALLF